MSLIRPVILAGGPGARLWPLSDARRPKPFLSIDGEASLLERTITRLRAPDLFAEPVVVCAAAHAEAARAALLRAGIAVPQLILEPEPRDTAAAIAVAAVTGAAETSSELMLVAPADHVIADPAAFRDACRLGAKHAAAGRLVLFGASPRSPHAGYGYIEAASDDPVSAVAAFHEKPDPAAAERYLASGAHLWNMGLFLAPAATFLALLETHAPDILRAARQAVDAAERTPGALRLQPAAFARAPRAAFDRAVVEKARGVMVARVDCGWSDVGAWDAVLERLPRDAAGNAVFGDARLLDVRGSLVRAEGVRVAAVGVEDLAIVATPEGVLVCRLDDAQRLKALVDDMKDEES